MGRRPYRTTCRPFRDSDTEVVVHWYVVPPTNGTLGHSCRINSLDWRDTNLNPSPVGEVSWEERPFDGWGRIVPPVKDAHVHGTREDFERGGLEVSDEPPLERSGDGIPLECRPEIGGVVIGGSALVIYPYPPSPGGVVLSGSARGGVRIPCTALPLPTTIWVSFTNGDGVGGERLNGRSYRMDYYGPPDTPGSARIWSNSVYKDGIIQSPVTGVGGCRPLVPIGGPVPEMQAGFDLRCSPIGPSFNWLIHNGGDACYGVGLPSLSCQTGEIGSLALPRTFLARIWEDESGNEGTIDVTFSADPMFW